MTFPGRLLAIRNLSPKKHMGQNFLIDPSTAEMIVRRADITKNDAAMEIGAGLGALTIPLARCAKTVYAVEKDRDLIEILSGVLAENKTDNVNLLNRNVFDVDIEKIAREERGRLTVFGNLPYNISSQVVIWAIGHRNIIDRAVFMFQKEVAMRIAACPGSGDYGRLSVMVQHYGSVARIAKVDAHQFYPRPKVDSEVIEIRFAQGGKQAEDDALFSSLVKAAFGQRRKTLKNALSGSGMGLDSRMVECMWENTSIDPVRRAETITVPEFVALANALKKCRDNGLKTR